MASRVSSKDDGLSLRVSNATNNYDQRSNEIERINNPKMKHNRSIDLDEEKKPARIHRFRMNRQILWVIQCLFVLALFSTFIFVCYYTMDNYMTPQIQSLVEEKNDLKYEIRKLNKQLRNISRIAESRLKVIHILKRQLEKKTKSLPGKESNFYDEEETKFKFETLSIVAFFVLPVIMFIIYRIYFLVQQEYLQNNRLDISSTKDIQHKSVVMQLPDGSYKKSTSAPCDFTYIQSLPNTETQRVYRRNVEEIL